MRVVSVDTGVTAGVPQATGRNGGPAGRPHAGRPRRDELVWALRAAGPPWLVARVVVAGALAFAHELSTRVNLSAPQRARVHQGLLGWDSGWYESIARHGYGGAGHESLRFFPLVPLLTRALSWIPGVGMG
ncbi:MAG TPA: hypothetical protein VMF60_00415, partial [Acidimicrobiales bacterium]|nr:hypothetical protein [Acidimicrobiales bacterium]